MGCPYELKSMFCEVYRQGWLSFKSIGDTITAVNQYIKDRARLDHLAAESGKALKFLDWLKESNEYISYALILLNLMAE